MTDTKVIIVRYRSSVHDTDEPFRAVRVVVPGLSPMELDTAAERPSKKTHARSIHSHDTQGKKEIPAAPKQKSMIGGEETKEAAAAGKDSVQRGPSAADIDSAPPQKQKEAAVEQEKENEKENEENTTTETKEEGAEIAKTEEESQQPATEVSEVPATAAVIQTTEPEPVPDDHEEDVDDEEEEEEEEDAPPATATQILRDLSRFDLLQVLHRDDVYHQVFPVMKTFLFVPDSAVPSSKEGCGALTISQQKQSNNSSSSTKTEKDSTTSKKPAASSSSPALAPVSTSGALIVLNNAKDATALMDPTLKKYYDANDNRNVIANPKTRADIGVRDADAAKRGRYREATPELVHATLTTLFEATSQAVGNNSPSESDSRPVQTVVLDVYVQRSSGNPDDYTTTLSLVKHSRRGRPGVAHQLPLPRLGAAHHVRIYSPQFDAYFKVASHEGLLDSDMDMEEEHDGQDSDAGSPELRPVHNKKRKNQNKKKKPSIIDVLLESSPASYATGVGSDTAKHFKYSRDVDLDRAYDHHHSTAVHAHEVDAHNRWTEEPFPRDLTVLRRDDGWKHRIRRGIPHVHRWFILPMMVGVDATTANKKYHESLEGVFGRIPDPLFVPQYFPHFGADYLDKLPQVIPLLPSGWRSFRLVLQCIGQRYPDIVIAPFLPAITALLMLALSPGEAFGVCCRLIEVSKRAMHAASGSTSSPASALLSPSDGFSGPSQSSAAAMMASSGLPGLLGSSAYCNNQQGSSISTAGAQYLSSMTNSGIRHFTLNMEASSSLLATTVRALKASGTKVYIKEDALMEILHRLLFSFFTTAFPQLFAMRILDSFLTEGNKVMVRYVIGIFVVLESHIKEAPNNAIDFLTGGPAVPGSLYDTINHVLFDKIVAAGFRVTLRRSDLNFAGDNSDLWYCTRPSVHAWPLISTDIVTLDGDLRRYEEMLLWLPLSYHRMTLLFRASEHSWSLARLYSCCIASRDLPALILMKTSLGFVIGMYTTLMPYHVMKLYGGSAVNYLFKLPLPETTTSTTAAVSGGAGAEGDGSVPRRGRSDSTERSSATGTSSNRRTAGSPTRRAACSPSRRRSLNTTAHNNNNLNNNNNNGGGELQPEVSYLDMPGLTSAPVPTGECYRATGINKSFILCEQNFLTFGNGPAIRIDGDLQHATSNACQTYGLRKGFWEGVADIVEVEVFSLE